MNNFYVRLLQYILPRRYWYRKFYMKSEHWWKCKTFFRFSRCENCGTEYNLDLHHKYYYRNGKSILWHERKKDFETLCRTCHQAEHKRSKA